MIGSQLAVTGRVHACLYEHGKLVADVIGHNLVVNGGLLRFANLVGGGSTGAVVQMICGSDNTWPSPQGSMTALGNQPAGGVVKTLTGGNITYASPATGQATVTFTATWAETENNTFTTYEVGLFAAGPLMVARYVFPSPGITKQNNQSLVIQYTVTFQAS